MNASTAISFEALKITPRFPFLLQTSLAKSKIIFRSCATGSNDKFNSEKSISLKFIGSLLPIPKAFEIGTSMLGLLICAMVDPSINVIIE